MVNSALELFHSLVRTSGRGRLVRLLCKLLFLDINEGAKFVVVEDVEHA